MVEFRDVVKKYAGTDEALGVPAGTVGGIPVVTPDDLGPAAAMTPAEVVTDEDAQAALSATFGLGAGWPRRSGSTQYLTDPYATAGGSPLPLTLGRTYGDWIVVPFDATITGYGFEVTTAADSGALIRSGLHQQTSVEATADLPLLHDGGTSDLSTTGVKQVTGLSIPVTAGTIIRPTLKWEAGTGSPAVRSNRSPRPTRVGITTIIGSTGSGGFCVDTTTSPGPFGTVRLDEAASATPRFALIVVAS